ncbi:MAG: retropepsin-like aspartic protease/reverse transcriptase, partial [Deltaproteobacteria bacterium]|nr:retropepsin-like aspartic protease/reverse transcriptase [Deltaproteobacteria bacterium]
MLLDSGSSVSLVQEGSILQSASITKIRPTPCLELVTASGEKLKVVDHISALVQVGEVQTNHQFVVVNRLVAPVILGVDFLQENGLVLDFSLPQVEVRKNAQGNQKRETIDVDTREEWEKVYGTALKEKARVCAIAAIDPAGDAVDECSIPKFGDTDSFEYPENTAPGFKAVVEEFKDLFHTSPGVTSEAQHYIPTTGNPVRVPPRRIPAHYRDKVEQQIQEMLDLGVIEESSSPWMAPAVFVKKKSGEIRLCVDYHELNKKTTKDAYPLPLPDEVQDRLAGSTIFSTLDLQSGYWQMPVHPEDQHKTAFCPGPGLGLFQFRRMPFGLTGAPSSFQRLMNKLLRGLPFATHYIDDILIHSASEEEHREHLRIVFERLQKAGLTLRGKKCRIGLSEVPYLGHIFSDTGMAPDPKKVKCVQEWPQPADAQALRQFLGLASYYRRYIHQFANVASPLNDLTQKDATYNWTPECENAFCVLKEMLTSSPVLIYPQFGPSASEFVLQTDASDVGLGAVLEQDGHVVAYASRSLSKSERNYSVIQKECLAAVYAMKQFRHYLLGRRFQLLTDHAPLQWLS